MPDSIGDEKVLKRPLEKNKELVKKAEKKGVYDITEGQEVVPCIYDEVSNDGILKEIVPVAQGDLYGLYSILNSATL